jgi:hypothetical protein
MFRGCMGQPIVVVETPSATHPGMVRFQTNRALTGTGHERYRASEEVRGNRPPDELARRMLARGGIEAIHINGSVITVDLAKGCDSAGLREIIESLYIHYPETLAGESDEGVEAPDAEAPGSEGELVEQESAAADAAPAPDRPDAEPEPPMAEELAAEVAAGEAAPTAPAPADPAVEPAAETT